MFGQLRDEFLETARVLHFQLLAAGPRAVDRRKLRCAVGFPTFGDDFDLMLELRALVRLGAHAGGADYDREGAFRIEHTEMQRRKTAHRQTDDVSLVDLEVIEDVDGVIDRAPLRVHRDGVRNVGRRIAARIVCDAAIATAKIAHLHFPRAVVAGKLMDEEDRAAGAGIFVIESHAIVGFQECHWTSSSVLRAPAPRWYLAPSSLRF